MDKECAFPLYKNDAKSIIGLNKNQRQVLSQIRNKLDSGEYSTVVNDCVCGNKHTDSDVKISEKDRYGLPFPQVLCSNCGVIRSEIVFDEASNLKFYEVEQKKLYVGKELPRQKYFEGQQARGERLRDKWKKHTQLERFSTVFDIGCGAGGIVSVFDEFEKISGCDFNKQYLDLGRSNGVDTHYGDFRGLIDDGSQDLIILSHVFEHLLQPMDMAKDIVEKLKVNGELLIEVPGVYSIPSVYGSPLHYFQHAHVYNYTKEHICEIFMSLGCEVEFADDVAVVLLRKVSDEGGSQRELDFSAIDVDRIKYDVCKMESDYSHSFSMKKIKNGLKKILIELGLK